MGSRIEMEFQHSHLVLLLCNVNASVSLCATVSVCGLQCGISSDHRRRRACFRRSERRFCVVFFDVLDHVASHGINKHNVSRFSWRHHFCMTNNCVWKSAVQYKKWWESRERGGEENAWRDRSDWLLQAQWAMDDNQNNQKYAVCQSVCHFVNICELIFWVHFTCCIQNEVTAPLFIKATCRLLGNVSITWVSTKRNILHNGFSKLFLCLAFDWMTQLLCDVNHSDCRLLVWSWLDRYFVTCFSHCTDQKKILGDIHGPVIELTPWRCCSIINISYLFSTRAVKVALINLTYFSVYWLFNSVQLTLLLFASRKALG